MRFFLLVFFILFSLHLKSQCFSSPGNPIGGTYNTGALKKGLLRATVFTRYSYTDKYYEGSKKIDYTYYEKAHYNYVGILLALGLTPRITLESESGYFPFKTVFYSRKYTLPYYEITGSGYSNFTPSLKFLIFANNEKRIFLSASVGVKVPFSREFIIKDNVELPVDVQPSTGAYGMVAQMYLMKENSFKSYRMFSITRYEQNGENEKKYRFGSSFMQSLFYSKHLYLANTPFPENWTAIIQARYEFRNMNKMRNELVTGTGGYAVFISPQLNYTIKEKWNVSVSGEFPVYQFLNNKQLGRGWAVLLNVTSDFKIFK